VNYEILALVVDKNPETASALKKALEPEFMYSTFEQACTITDAFQAHAQKPIQFCIIAPGFKPEELEIFFQDIRTMGRDKECVFVELQDTLPADGSRPVTINKACVTVITRAGTLQDKEVLKHVLKEHFKGGKIREKLQDVESAMQHALSAIDKAAKDRRRGSKKPIDKTMIDFVRDQTNFDEKVLEGFYNKLADKTGTTKAPEATKIKIPDKVLKKNLPGLKEDTYDGVSTRVWDKLVKHHGLKDSPPGANAPADPAQEASGAASPPTDPGIQEKPTDPDGCDTKK
jgi:hypothetical protein